MFRWHKEIARLDLPASQVLHLERSLTAVQVALPGLPAQAATAYLCAFAAGKGVRVAVALHLHASRLLAFYLHERGEAPRQEAGQLIEEGFRFAESMGFMLSDMDYQKLGMKKRDLLWASLPLKTGVESPALAQGPPVPAPVPVSAGPAGGEGPEPSPPPPATVSGELAESAEEAPPAPAEELPDVLPGRGAALRTRVRKRPPTAEEMESRRLKLLENLGRFLASL